jgi:hypothetical protein
MHYQGDSISQLAPNPFNTPNVPWYAGPGTLLDRIQAIFGPVPPLAKLGSGPVSTTVAQGLVQPGYNHINLSGYGSAGATAPVMAGQLVANGIPKIPTALSAHSPVLVLECGINDAIAIANATETFLQFQTGYALIISNWLAAFPAGRIIALGCCCYTEAWAGTPGSPTWVGTALHTQIAQVDTEIQAQIAALGAAGTYVDVQAAVLAWEVINNPTKIADSQAFNPNGGPGQPAIHPNLNGMIIMADAFFAAVTVSL